MMQMESILYQGSQSHRYLAQQNLLSNQDIQHSINPQSLSAQLLDQYQCQYSYQYQHNDESQQSYNTGYSQNQMNNERKNNKKMGQIVVIWILIQECAEWLCWIIGYIVTMRGVGFDDVWLGCLFKFTWAICVTIAVLNMQVQTVTDNHKYIQQSPSKKLLTLLHQFQTHLVQLSVLPNKSPQITQLSHTIIDICSPIFKTNKSTLMNLDKQRYDGMGCMDGIRLVIRLGKVIDTLVRECSIPAIGANSDNKLSYLLYMYQNIDASTLKFCTKIAKSSILQHRCRQSYQILHRYYQNVMAMQKYIGQQQHKRAQQQNQYQYKNVYYQYLLKLLRYYANQIKKQQHEKAIRSQSTKFNNSNRNNNNNSKYFTLLKLIKSQLQLIRTNVHTSSNPNKPDYHTNDTNSDNKQNDQSNNIESNQINKHYHNGQFVCFDMDENISVVSDHVVQGRIQELRDVLDCIIDNRSKQQHQQVQQKQKQDKNVYESQQKIDQSQKYSKQRRVQGFNANLFKMVDNKKNTGNYYL